jgi:nucleotide-binding universal stress UspA family protein
MKIQRILWPTDFSNLSLNALPMVNQMAQQFSASLDVVHALQGPPVMVAAGAPDAAAVSLSSYPTQNRERCEKAIQRIVASHIVGQVEARWEILCGSPPYAIVDYAHDHHTDLIILCTHGETGLTRLVFGSVAEKVVRLATCPVLVIPSLGREESR